MLWPIVLVGCFGSLTIKLPVTLASFADAVFHSGSAGCGLLGSVVAISSVIGARPVAYTVASSASAWRRRCFSGANSTVQLAAADAIWERLMGVYLLVDIDSGAAGGSPARYGRNALRPAVRHVAGLVPAIVTAAVAAKLARSAGLGLTARSLTGS